MILKRSALKHPLHNLFYLVQDGLELITSCLGLAGAEITEVHHHAQQSSYNYQRSQDFM